MSAQPDIDLNTPVGDRVAKTTCYMCACRCGIDVYLRDVPGGRAEVRYIDGNRDHPLNKGVICGKGASGIMQHCSPARLRAPMKRVGPRGSGEFQEITWEEALSLATEWMGKVRKTDPKRLAFFTGRDQSQSLTGFWAMKFGTPNFAAHGGVLFGEHGGGRALHLRWCVLGIRRSRLGAHESISCCSAWRRIMPSNPIKIGIGKLKERGAKIVSINPVRTGYNAVADEWVGVRPSTDGLFVGRADP